MTAPSKSRRPSQVSTEEPLHPPDATESTEGSFKETIGSGSVDAAQITETKQHLRAALANHHGSSKHSEVVAIIHELAALNPTQRPARSPLMLGDWRNLSAPHFPDRIAPEEGEEDVFKYTLGRISFNLFEPRKLVCTVESIENPIEPIRGEEEGEAAEDNKMTYPAVCGLVFHTPEGDLRATMRNEGTVVPATDDRASVVFTSGGLHPAPEVLADAAKLALWRKTFENAYERANAERSYLARAGRAVFFGLMGLVTPTDAADSFRFEMKRAPKGWLDVLYLDEEMRITKGNRGSYVVVEKGS